MPSRFDRATDVTQRSLTLAAIPAVATLLSGSKVAQALAAGPGGGVTFPMPTGLPTLWTYVSLPSGPGGMTVSGPLSVVAFVPLFVLGLLITSALEAGFLHSLAKRINGEPIAFIDGVKKFILRMVGVNLLRAALVVAVAPLIVVPPLAILVLLGLMYLLYGLPFEIVVRDLNFSTAIETTVSDAFDGGSYASFGIAHLIAGAVGSAFLSSLVRTGGFLGILFGTILIAVPAVFVAVYGLLVFRELSTTEDKSVENLEPS